MTNVNYEAWLDGISLSSFSPYLYISGIAYKNAECSFGTYELAGRYGEREQSRKWKGAQVEISFYLKKMDVRERQVILGNISAWALRGGSLTTGDRAGQALRVRCTGLPEVSDVCDWTTPAKITFKAFEKPFWTEVVPATLSMTGSSGNGLLYVPGNAENALVEVTITPASSMANITITVGDTSMTLTGVAATSSAPVTITYDAREILHIQRGTTSLLNKRTGSDDLLARCGASTAVSFSASASATVTLAAKGAWI